MTKDNTTMDIRTFASKKKDKDDFVNKKEGKRNYDI